MFSGAIINSLYPLINISRPISLVPLIITESIITLGLCLICHLRNRNSTDIEELKVKIKRAYILPAVFLCSLPAISVFGAYHLVRLHQNSTALMMLIGLIAVVVLLVTFNKFIFRELYPLAIFSIGLSLLFHYPLVSEYIVGWDIASEYRNANLVIDAGYWIPKITDNVRDMLSIPVLTPTYALTCGIETKWVFKVIYPILYALVPVGLYKVVQRQTTEKIAFLSCFFFMAYYMFYLMPHSARLEIAEIFLVSFLLMIVSNYATTAKGKALLLIFTLSIVVSHYGYTYLFIIVLTVAYIALRLWKQLSNDNTNTTLPANFIVLFIIFTLVWYTYISGALLRTAYIIGSQILYSIFPALAGSKIISSASLIETSNSIGMILYNTVSPLHEVHKYLHLISQCFISIGLLIIAIKHKVTEINRNYFALSLGAFALCLMCLFIPYFSAAMNTTRLYHFALIFLAPFFALGVISAGHYTKLRSPTILLKALSIFLVIHFLFNTGFIYEITKDNPTSHCLSPYIDHIGCNKNEAKGIEWLSNLTEDMPLIYSDAFGRQAIYSIACTKVTAKRFPIDFKEITEGSYIYLRSWNIQTGDISHYIKKGEVNILEYIKIAGLPHLQEILNNSELVFQNEGCKIYHYNFHMELE